MPRLVDHQQRRLEFATAVWEIIAQKGIEGVTLRAVAQTAGVSMGQVQHYYSSREELVQDSCRQMITMAEQQFHAPDNPLSELRALLTHAIPTNEQFRRGAAVWAAYIAKSVDDPVIAELIAQAQNGTVAHAAHLIEQARTMGTLQQTGRDPQALALELLSCAEGLATRALIGTLSSDKAHAALEERLSLELADSSE